MEHTVIESIYENKNNRNRITAIVRDLISDAPKVNKMMLAFDNGILEVLQEEITDEKKCKFIDTLMNFYGATKQTAIEAFNCWCTILDKEENCIVYRENEQFISNNEPNKIVNCIVNNDIGNDVHLKFEDFNIYSLKRVRAFNLYRNFLEQFDYGYNWWRTYCIGDDFLTYRNIKAGDSVDDVVGRYGQPNIIKSFTIADELLQATKVLKNDIKAKGDFKHCDEDCKVYIYYGTIKKRDFAIRFYVSNDRIVKVIGFSPKNTSIITDVMLQSNLKSLEIMNEKIGIMNAEYETGNFSFRKNISYVNNILNNTKALIHKIISNIESKDVDKLYKKEEKEKYELYKIMVNKVLKKMKEL